MNRLAFGRLNISTLRNKQFDFLKRFVKNSLDIFMISKTKLDETFSELQCLMDGFIPPHRVDRNAFYIREDIPSRQISMKNDGENIGHVFVKINLRKKNG